MTETRCSACGWTASEPSRIQAEAAFEKHRLLACPNYSSCALCTELGPGRRRSFEGKVVFMCTRCEGEHPRQGGYSFDHGKEPSRSSVGRSSAKHGNRSRR